MAWKRELACLANAWRERNRIGNGVGGRLGVILGVCVLVFSSFSCNHGNQVSPSAGGQKGGEVAEAPSSGASLENRVLGFEAPSEPENLISNPGFESGLEGWQWLEWSKGWSEFKLSSDHAYSGRQSLHLPIFSADRRQTVVWGGVQEIALTGEIPECIDGYYYVENWEKGDWKQYLQLVLIDLTHALPGRSGNAQLRYIVSGSTEPPLTISNAQYLFVENPRRATPVVGKWTYFSVNPRRDFMKSWNYTPSAGAKLRVLFEARYDYHLTSVPARGDVYYDQLYFGPKTKEHCAE